MSPPEEDEEVADKFHRFKQSIDRYRAFTGSLDVHNFEDFRSRFESLRSGLAPIKAQTAARDLAFAPNFNIFQLLNPKEYEKAHSDFLAELLRPKGNHGQQVLFLKSFLELCETRCSTLPKLSTEIMNAGQVWVEREHSTAQGRLDIVIRSIAPRFIIAIENKVNAGDQDKQLERYSRWLERQSRYLPERKILVYLAAREGQRVAAKNKKLKYVLTLSYGQVGDWLRNCRPAIKAQRTKDLVNQYIESINLLHESDEDADRNQE